MKPFMKIYLCVDWDSEDSKKLKFTIQPILKEGCGDRTPTHPVYKLALIESRKIRETINSLSREDLENLKTELRKLIKA